MALKPAWFFQELDTIKRRWLTAKGWSQCPKSLGTQTSCICICKHYTPAHDMCPRDSRAFPFINHFVVLWSRQYSSGFLWLFLWALIKVCEGKPSLVPDPPAPCSWKNHAVFKAFLLMMVHCLYGILPSIASMLGGRDLCNNMLHLGFCKMSFCLLNLPRLPTLPP